MTRDPAPAAPASPASTSPRPRRGRIWPWVAGGLLAATVAKYAIVLALIGSNPSLAIEEDYYERAVAWDGERARRAASEELGWSARVAIAPAPDRPGRAELRIELADRGGRPVAGARVTARVFHQARADLAIEGLARAGADGAYRLEVPGARGGNWRVEIEAERSTGIDTGIDTGSGTERFVDARTVLFGAPPSAGGGAP